MASTFLKDKIFSTKNLAITVNGLPIYAYGFNDEDDVIFHIVETLDWEEEKHFYYEWIISDKQWQEASVDKNQIIVKYGDSPLVIEIWKEVPVNLQEFQQS